MIKMGWHALQYLYSPSFLLYWKIFVRYLLSVLVRGCSQTYAYAVVKVLCGYSKIHTVLFVDFVPTERKQKKRRHFVKKLRLRRLLRLLS